MHLDKSCLWWRNRPRENPDEYYTNLIHLLLATLIISSERLFLLCYCTSNAIKLAIRWSVIMPGKIDPLQYCREILFSFIELWKGWRIWKLWHGILTYKYNLEIAYIESMKIENVLVEVKLHQMPIHDSYGFTNVDPSLGAPHGIGTHMGKRGVSFHLSKEGQWMMIHKIITDMPVEYTCILVLLGFGHVLNRPQIFSGSDLTQMCISLPFQSKA